MSTKRHHMTQGLFYREDIMVINMYVANNTAAKNKGKSIRDERRIAPKIDSFSGRFLVHPFQNCRSSR